MDDEKKLPPKTNNGSKTNPPELSNKLVKEEPLVKSEVKGKVPK